MNLISKRNMTFDEYMAQLNKESNSLKRPQGDVEHRMQCTCVKWFASQYPKLRGRLFAVPNGGRRDNPTGAKLKAEGVIPGVADLILLKRNHRYGALLIEMKTPWGTQSSSQKEWQAGVCSEDEYKYVVCRSVDDFIREVKEYLNNL